MNIARIQPVGAAHIQDLKSDNTSRQNVNPSESKREGNDQTSERQAPNQQILDDAIHKINETMETYNTELRFVLHEKSGEMMVKVVNPKDNTVIREIPPEEILDIVADVKEMLGIIVNKLI